MKDCIAFSLSGERLVNHLDVNDDPPPQYAAIYLSYAMEDRKMSKVGLRKKFARSGMNAQMCVADDVTGVMARKESVRSLIGQCERKAST